MLLNVAAEWAQRHPAFRLELATSASKVMKFAITPVGNALGTLGSGGRDDLVQRQDDPRDYILARTR